MVDLSLPYDEDISDSTTIDPEGNNPTDFTQTSRIQTNDDNNIEQDGFDLSVNLTGTNVTETVNIAVVIDTSGSTAADSGTDFDGDGTNETVLEAELYAAKELFDAYVEAGHDPSEINITLVTYASDAEVVGTFSLNDEAAFVSALQDINDDGSSGWTRMDDGLEAVNQAWTDAGVDDSTTNVVVFMSDGEAQPNGGDQNIEGESQDLEDDFGAVIQGIGLGANSSLDDLNRMDNTGPGGTPDAEQVLSGQELLDIVVEPLTDADFLRFEVVIDGVDENGDPTQEIHTYYEGDPEVSSTQLGWSIDNVTIDTDLEGPQDVTITVNAYFGEDPGDPGSGEQVVTTSHDIPLVICFTPGTMILTPKGEVAIETLVAGDRVVTRDHGVQAIRWIGSTELAPVMLDLNKNLRPILIKKGALGTDLPSQDLRVSRQHRILVRDWRAEMMFGSEGGVLVPAFTLCNDSSIIEERPKDIVTYIHMAFDNHEIVYADGVETESFHPAARTISGMSDDAKQELLALFPNLEENALHAYDSARDQIRAREATVIREA